MIRIRRRAAVAGLAGLAASAGLLLLTALLGPSAMQPALPGAAGQPPYSLVAHPAPEFIAGLTAAGIVLGALGLALCLYAGAALGMITPKRLVLAGGLVAVAFMLMPPVGSGDHLNYAAYGRMVATGHDPYATAARDLPGDPVADAVEAPWREEPSLYGPLATAQQTLAAKISGDSVRLTVFVLSVTNTAAFIAVGLLLHRLAARSGLTGRSGHGRQLRAALLWAANPLLLYLLVGGAHNDVLAIAFVVGGIAVFCARGKQSCLLAGALIGAGAAVKLNAAIIAAGPAWVLLRSVATATTKEGAARQLARLGAFCGGAAAVIALAYALAGPHAFDQLSRASKSVSLATPWHLVSGPGGGLLDVTLTGQTVRRSWMVLAIVLFVLLLHGLRRTPGGGDSDPGATAMRVSAAVALAWLFATPYALPWYDGLGWALVAMLPACRFDALLLARTTLLAVAYLPARDPSVVDLPDWLINVWRSEVTPWALTVLLAALIAASLHRPAPGHVHMPRVPAERPG